MKDKEYKFEVNGIVVGTYKTHYELADKFEEVLDMNENILTKGYPVEFVVKKNEVE